MSDPYTPASGCAYAYQFCVENVAHRGCHVDVLSNDKVRAHWSDLVRHPFSFLPLLFPDDPDAIMIKDGFLFRGIMSHHVLYSLHFPECTLKRLPCLDDMVCVLIKEGSGREGIVVGHAVKPWRLCKIGQH